MSKLDDITTDNITKLDIKILMLDIYAETLHEWEPDMGLAEFSKIFREKVSVL